MIQVFSIFLFLVFSAHAAMEGTPSWESQQPNATPTGQLARFEAQKKLECARKLGLYVTHNPIYNPETLQQLLNETYALEKILEHAKASTFQNTPLIRELEGRHATLVASMQTLIVGKRFNPVYETIRQNLERVDPKKCIAIQLVFDRREESELKRIETWILKWASREENKKNTHGLFQIDYNENDTWRGGSPAPSGGSYKPWIAVRVSSPHYALMVLDHLPEIHVAECWDRHSQDRSAAVIDLMQVR